MASWRRTLAKATSMLYSVAVFGIGVGIGTSVLIYRLLQHWLRPPPGLPSEAEADNSLSQSSTKRECLTNHLQESSTDADNESSSYRWHSSSVDNCEGTTDAGGVRHRQSANYSNLECYSGDDLKLGQLPAAPSECSVVETLRHSLFNNNTPAFAAAHSSPAHLFNEEELQEELPKLLKQCNVEDWSFSMNVGNSYSCLQESDKTSPCEHELQQPTVKKPDEGECCPDTIVRKPPLGRRETPDAGHSFANCSFSPSLMSFQHSTPDEQTTLATVSRVEPTNLESLFMSDNGHNELKCEEVNNDCTDEKIDAKFTVSWHDWSAGDRRRSRSCVSLDESMFLSNDLALIDSPCATDICTAVTSLEQLEREIAGVLSDCGEMERCVGVLRQHDQRDQVAKRYSLGVADSVIAADVRLLGGWRDMSAVSEVPNSSASVIHGRDSGYIWDDELMGNDSVPLRTSTSSASITRRITRSLSPQPTTRAERRYANARSSFGACVVDAHACGLVSADQKVEKETNTPPPVDSAQCLRGLLVSEGAID